MPRVVHFDLPADNPETLKGFYENVFDWKFKKWTAPDGSWDYWGISTGDGPGIDGGMAKKSGSNDQVANTIAVSSVDEFAKKIEANGGKILLSKMAIPGVGWIASFEDPQGNKQMILEEDGEAK